jgi:hypothetical protein
LRNGHSLLAWNAEHEKSPNVLDVF